MRITTAVLALFTCAGALAAQEAKIPERAAANRSKGAENATVTVYEIADFQCPYCARFARDVEPKIDSAYVKTGKIRWIYMNFPLPQHPFAWLSAEAAMCAGGVSDKFWGMHDKLFANQTTWASAPDPVPLFDQYARELGIPLAAYHGCTNSDAPASIIVRDLLTAAGTGMTGTPAFVVNNEPIFAGYKPFDEWKDILEAALKKAPAKPGASK